MEVLLHWRHNNPTDSWESIETALQEIKLFGLAYEIRSRFIAPSEPEEVLHNDDIPPAMNLSETLGKSHDYSQRFINSVYIRYYIIECSY
jgi:hypothetical protein